MSKIANLEHGQLLEIRAAGRPIIRVVRARDQCQPPTDPGCGSKDIGEVTAAGCTFEIDHKDHYHIGLRVLVSHIRKFRSESDSHYLL